MVVTRVDGMTATDRSLGSSGPWARLATALAVVWLLSGCTEGDETDDSARDAAIYRSVIVDLVDRSGVELESDEDLPLIYVEAIGPDGIPLAVQIEVVGGLVEQYEIRFIDHLDEAIEAELPGSPVRDGSLLIGLGDVDIDRLAEVHAEVYRRDDDIRGFGFTLEEVEELRWDVVDTPVDVEPDGLVPQS